MFRKIRSKIAKLMAPIAGLSLAVSATDPGLPTEFWDLLRKLLEMLLAYITQLLGGIFA